MKVPSEKVGTLFIRHINIVGIKKFNFLKFISYKGNIDMKITMSSRGRHKRAHNLAFTSFIQVVLSVVLLIFVILFVLNKKDVKIVEAYNGSYVKSNITYETIKDDILKRSFDFVDNNNESQTLSLKQLGVKVEIPKENKEYIKKHMILNYEKLNIKLNTDGLKGKLEELNKDRKDNVYASIEKGDTEFKVTEPVEGNLLDIDKLSDYIINMLDTKETFIGLAGFYVEKDKDKPTYDSLKETVDKINSTHVKYQNGYEIKLVDYIKYFDVKDNTVVANEDTLEEFNKELDDNIEKNLAEYDTVGNKISFKTTDGNTIDIDKGTWGNIFDSDSETEYVIDKLTKFESEDNRVPIYSQEMSSDIGNTYIEVSIDKQHVWHYVNGQLCCESDCVTGKLDGKHATPTGAYHLLERKNGKMLTPSGASKGTWVNQWMRVTWSGVGLHDAYWRGSFGGNIYRSNGSHGCINLPKNYAAKLYNETYVGMPVVIY